MNSQNNNVIMSNLENLNLPFQFIVLVLNLLNYQSSFQGTLEGRLGITESYFFRLVEAFHCLLVFHHLKGSNEQLNWRRSRQQTLYRELSSANSLKIKDKSNKLETVDY
ncbi:hypothetical protein LINPERPRIM_LOCUS25085 [Linum perenne]